jgi:hypothetical protein
MFAILRLENSRLCPQMRVLRVMPDEDVATEYAYQCALDAFDTSDNIDVVDGASLNMDLPDFCTGFSAYRQGTEGVVFAVVSVPHKRKRTASGGTTLF